MEKKKCWRHGDVIIREVEKIPTGAIEQKTEKIILAYGEVTGHAHRISEGVGHLFNFDDKTYLKITSERAALTHEEHKRIDLPQGDFEIIIQKDYEPKGWQKVVD